MIDLAPVALSHSSFLYSGGNLSSLIRLEYKAFSESGKVQVNSVLRRKGSLESFCSSREIFLLSFFEGDLHFGFDLNPEWSKVSGAEWRLR